MNKQISKGVVVVILLILMAVPARTSAQWGIGASVEIREEVPENGFGVRIERKIVQKVPVVDLRLRGHASFFNEENDAGTRELKTYDIGVMALGGISIGLIKPYAGFGIGLADFDLEDTDLGFSADDKNVFWNVVLGAEVSPLPALKPFFEYRFQQVDEPDFISDSDGRLVFGVSLFF